MFLFVFSCFSCGVPWCASISVDFQPLDPPGAQRGLEGPGGPGGPGGLGTDGRLLPGSREAQLCHVVSHPWNLDQVRVGRCRWNTCAQSSPSCGHVFAASLVPSEAASASCRHHRGWHSANHGSASIRSSDEAPKHQAGSKWRDCWQVVFYRRDSVWQYPGHKHQQECGLGVLLPPSPVNAEDQGDTNASWRMEKPGWTTTKTRGTGEVAAMTMRQRLPWASTRPVSAKFAFGHAPTAAAARVPGCWRRCGTVKHGSSVVKLPQMSERKQPSPSIVASRAPSWSLPDPWRCFVPLLPLLPHGNF